MVINSNRDTQINKDINNTYTSIINENIFVRSDLHTLIILIELMYIDFVRFDWTRALSPVCFGFVYNSMNFFI